jgi:hypothetical protein
MQHAQLREGSVPSPEGRQIVNGDGERVEHRLAPPIGFERRVRRRTCSHV